MCLFGVRMRLETERFASCPFVLRFCLLTCGLTAVGSPPLANRAPSVGRRRPDEQGER